MATALEGGESIPMKFRCFDLERLSYDYVLLREGQQFAKYVRGGKRRCWRRPEKKMKEKNSSSSK